MINIDFYAGGIDYRETKNDKVYFCAILETNADDRVQQVTVRHFLASDDQDAEELLKSQEVEDLETGYRKKFSAPIQLKLVLDQLNMVVIDEGGLSILEED